MNNRSTCTRRRCTRRRVLQTAAGSILLAGCSGRGQPSTGTDSGGSVGSPSVGGTRTSTPTKREYRGITFDRILDAVDDLGFDDTGGEPIDEPFDEAYRTGTLIEFPPGEYLVAGEHDGRGVSRFGILGTGATHRDTRITPTEGTALEWLKAVDAGSHLIENLSFHERSDDTTQLSVWLRTTGGSVVKDVEWLGRTPDDSGVSYTLTAECVDVDGVLSVDGLYAGLDEPAKTVDYPDGVQFIRAGPHHKGEVVLRDPVIHNRNSSATRYTWPTGVLTIIGGEFVNNENANIRFGAGDHPTKVSSATGSYVRVDADSEGTNDAVRVDANNQGYSGAVFRELAIEWRKTQGRGVISFPRFGGHGSATFYDCVVHNAGSETNTVSASAVQNTEDVVQPPNTSVHFENCSFTGSGLGFTCVARPGSSIVDSCIDMPRASIEGFETNSISRSHCRRPDD